jgi:large subunit ribosomal protein L25
MFEIKAKNRDIKIKREDLSKVGEIPAVFYGKGEKANPISISLVEFKKVWHKAGESSAVKLVVDGKNVDTLIQDVQLDPVKNTPVHVDFYVIEKGQKVHVKTPIEFVGESAAVKAGGVLVKVMHELSIEGEPSKLPHEFTVDIAALVANDSVIKVGDIKLPAGVELYHVTADDIIASIAVAQEESDEAPVVDLSSIEVEAKGKKEEEGEVTAA